VPPTTVSTRRIGRRARSVHCGCLDLDDPADHRRELAVEQHQVARRQRGARPGWHATGHGTRFCVIRPWTHPHPSPDTALPRVTAPSYRSVCSYFTSMQCHLTVAASGEHRQQDAQRGPTTVLTRQRRGDLPVGRGRAAGTDLEGCGRCGVDGVHGDGKRGLQVCCPGVARRRAAGRRGARFFKPLRQIIESINQTVKGQLDLERPAARTQPAWPGGDVRRPVEHPRRRPEPRTRRDPLAITGWRAGPRSPAGCAHVRVPQEARRAATKPVLPLYDPGHTCFLAGANGPPLIDNLARQAAADPAQHVTYSGVFRLRMSISGLASRPCTKRPMVTGRPRRRTMGAFCVMVRRDRAGRCGPC
jgi:hypothetical protein